MLSPSGNSPRATLLTLRRNLLWGFFAFGCALGGVRAQTPLIAENPAVGDFSLARPGFSTSILVESTADPAVARAVEDLRTDIERVSGTLPAKLDERSALPREFVLVGIAGKSALLDQLVTSGKIDLRPLTGAWESFAIQVVAAPLPGVDRVLVIAGSDRRGAIYGAYEISEAIGVSPWHWWADVTPARKDSLFIVGGARRFGPPSVKYRGIFINDEDWGLQPWAAKTHEPANSDIGPKTYARVFELLLRLKANLLWPAMHPSTKPFNDFAENKRVADRYGVIMGSSHAEPMLRNNVGEWKEPALRYNYLANREGVIRYWEDRLRENGQFENVYTLGMRGIHDSNMIGPRTDEQRIATLEKIFADQRALLRQHTRDGEAAPQMFCAYKEVLDLYRKGLKVPDDVTIVWPDDNFGYIRNFAGGPERQRSGGFGVYYHVSYLGRPLAYLWLNTTPPGLIWEEMHKAYEHGADRMWIVNVGDIKPAEIATEFFLQMAWDIRRWHPGNLDRFLPTWAAREFGVENSQAITDIMTGYYRLNFERKPEHLQWWLPGETPRESPLTSAQIATRLEAFQRIAEQTRTVERSISAAKQDAFFELVKYPVLGSAAANRRYFHAEAYARLFNYNLPAARQHATRANAAHDELEQLTRYFNESVAGGKWRHIISLEPADNQWKSMRIGPANLPSPSMGASTVETSPLPFGLPPGGPITNFRLEIDPAKFSSHRAAGGAAWTALPGFARSGTVLVGLPTTVSAFEPASSSVAPQIEYTVSLPAAGKFRVTLKLLPTHPIISGQPSRVAVRLGGAPLQILTNGTRDGSAEWSQAVLNNSVPLSAVFETSGPGPTPLQVQMVDPGVALEGITVESIETLPAAEKS